MSTTAAAAPGSGPAEGALEPPRGRVRGWIHSVTGGAPLYPLAILFGLYAVDQLDQTAFGVLLPEIQDHFGLDKGGILAVVALASVVALLLSVPIGFYADRVRRVPVAVVGAVGWGLFSVLTGLAPVVWVLTVARAGSGLAGGVIMPTHNSLLADYYDIPVRTKVYAVHRAAASVGAFVGPLLAGIIAFYVGWRWPFLIFSIPTMVLVVLAARLREPVRGRFERAAMGAAAETVATEDVAPSLAESWRIVWNVGTLRRIFYALPFLAVAFVGLLSLVSLYYSEIFGLDERARGFIAAGAEPAQLVGLLVGVPIATRLVTRDAALVLRFLAGVAIVVAGAWTLFALTPNLALAVAMNVVISGVLVVLVPGIFAALSLAVPPKVRSFGFSVAALWILPGLIALPVIGSLADHYGIRTGLLAMVPIFLVGAFLIASAGSEVNADIKKVWTSAAAQSEVLYERRQGRVKLLLVRGLDVHYDGVQVLFGVDFEVDEGEIVALLGTNGAGKSTLLKAISGLVEASAGAVVFDGRDMTYTPPDETAGRGVTQVPGGQGVFPSLTVKENLALAAWLHRHDRGEARERAARVLDTFPVLAGRLDEPAGNLSGGQQQMLTLGMAFVERPRLLMIDELSLGLAPAVVGRLLGIVEELRRAGTTIVLVEQSVNVALQVAETAYFMEKGEIRFHGPTAELMERPDVLRSVFLEGAARGIGRAAGATGSSANGATATHVPPLPVPAAAPDDVPPAPGGNGTRAPDPELRLEVRDLSKRFGGVAALDGVGFDVRAGEILGFIGPNGAGKTTLFDVVSGFLAPDAGRVLMRAEDGEVDDITEMAAARRARLGLGRSFQDGRLFPSLTVAETIALAFDRHVEVRDPVAAALHLPAVAHSERAVTARVDELVELLGLGAFRDKFVRELSTGSRRIVDLACSLAHRPSVLLLDEPSSGIAQREAEALGPLLRRVRDELGASLLLIEHDIALLRGLADRILPLDLGRVVAIGAPQDVVNDPRVVESYLGTSAAAIDRSGPSHAPTTPDPSH
ncbi:MAG: MFS transporter [Acidimicrobiia bacterium]|nr:MFS transporter [Acidimicrobiia bacterium]